jgi:hypothetical protein
VIDLTFTVEAKHLPNKAQIVFKKCVKILPLIFISPQPAIDSQREKPRNSSIVKLLVFCVYHS